MRIFMLWALKLSNLLIPTEICIDKFDLSLDKINLNYIMNPNIKIIFLVIQITFNESVFNNLCKYFTFDLKGKELKWFK